ncbi:MAG: hypothetical protein KBS75_09190 [Bacteroidales bacterium]|nr:hypothetical protein [Candidatus Equimonas faecalis]
MDAVIIRILENGLPLSVKGTTVKDENGDYNIYINGRISEEARVKALRHELQHIQKGHFYDERPVKELEKEII